MNSPTQPSPAFGRWRSWLPRVVFESVLIVLSVLLALALDEWRRERQQRTNLSFAIESIRAELNANRLQLRGSMHDTTPYTILYRRTQLAPICHPRGFTTEACLIPRAYSV